MEVPGPYREVPQNEQVRAAVPGRRVGDGEPATLIVIYSPQRNAWVFHIDSDPGPAVAVGVEGVGPLVDLLRTDGKRSWRANPTSHAGDARDRDIPGE